MGDTVIQGRTVKGRAITSACPSIAGRGRALPGGCLRVRLGVWPCQVGRCVCDLFLAAQKCGCLEGTHETVVRMVAMVVRGRPLTSGGPQTLPRQARLGTPEVVLVALATPCRAAPRGTLAQTSAGIPGTPPPTSPAPPAGFCPISITRPSSLGHTCGDTGRTGSRARQLLSGCVWNWVRNWTLGHLSCVPSPD